MLVYRLLSDLSKANIVCKLPITKSNLGIPACSIRRSLKHLILESFDNSLIALYLGIGQIHELIVAKLKLHKLSQLVCIIPLIHCSAAFLDHFIS